MPTFMSTVRTLPHSVARAITCSSSATPRATADGRAMQIVGGNMVHQLSAVRIGRAFVELGFECKRTKATRGYIVVQRTADEIKSRLQTMAGDG